MVPLAGDVVAAIWFGLFVAANIASNAGGSQGIRWALIARSHRGSSFFQPPL